MSGAGTGRRGGGAPSIRTFKSCLLRLHIWTVCLWGVVWGKEVVTDPSISLILNCESAVSDTTAKEAPLPFTFRGNRDHGHLKQNKQTSKNNRGPKNPPYPQILLRYNLHAQNCTIPQFPGNVLCSLSQCSFRIVPPVSDITQSLPQIVIYYTQSLTMIILVP